MCICFSALYLDGTPVCHRTNMYIHNLPTNAFKSFKVT